MDKWTSQAGTCVKNTMVLVPIGMVLPYTLEWVLFIYFFRVIFQGEKFKIPQTLLDQLPAGVTLDGELWGGYCSQHLTNRYIQSGQWNKLEYLVFDSPGTRDLCSKG